MATKAEEIAAQMREKIRSGELPPDTKLASIEDLAAEHGVGLNTARRVLTQLKAESLVEYRAGRGGSSERSGGTYVRRRSLPRMARSRSIERDEMGYYSGQNVQHWRRIPGTSTTTATRPAPPDIAELLGVEPGTPVLVRERLNGDPEQPQYRQLTDSWLHPDVVEALPILAGDTGLGGTYDRIEEWAQQPITWTEEITAAAPSPAEVDALQLPPGVPMLRVLRVSSVGRGKQARVVEVNDIRMSGELFSVRYPLQRQGAARWPVQPAGADFYSN